ncbi:MAG: Hsp33 family molecular chaperone HslO [Bacillota bacterium]|nr:Hsp33 family molecular chaperone HslO [Bacillota bacterium]
MGYMIRGIDKKLSFRFMIVNSTDVVEKAREYHETSPVATAALGRMLTAGLMMGYTMKYDKDKLTLRVNGGGPAGTVLVTSDCNGNVKGYIQNPRFFVEDKENGKLNVGKAIGTNGTLKVIRDIGMKEPYIGQSQLITGEIGEDIASYYFESEQQPTVIGLGVLVDKDISVKSAGGFMIQTMPDLKEEEIVKIEKQVSKLKNVSDYFKEGKSLEKIAEEILSEFDIEITEKIPVEYKCDCSKDRTEEILISVGKEDLEKIIKEDGQAEVTCRFCDKKYLFNKKDLERILENL